jgi:hypothetical protein
MVVHVINGTISDEERDAYIGIAREKYGEGCAQLDIFIDGDYVELGYHVTPFEHIRRITGYLVGTVDRWNNAKRAELADRLPHGKV